MKVKIVDRKDSKKSVLRQVRREGNIPAVVYSPGKENRTIIVDGVDFQTALRTLTPGRLPTTQFVLVQDGKEERAIVKDIQYHPTTYEVMHLDFLIPSDRVKVRVPIECVGVADCQGIKLGGFLRQVIRALPVECLASQIPAFFSIDIRHLVIGQSLRIFDLTVPEGVRPLVDSKEAILVIAKR